VIEKVQLFQNLLNKVRNIARESLPTVDRLDKICKLLKENVPGYDWVGFYMVNPEDKKELILGPFSGEPTEHIRIPFGKGICGRAAETEQIFIVDDVAEETNYLSCNPRVKSEIVLPIFKNKEIIRKFDLDSHAVAAFEKEDEDFLGEICKIVSRIL